jgi:phosphomannomutase
MSCVLRKLSEISDVAVVSGSAFETLREQLLLDNADNQSIFRFIFAENGVDGYHLGEPLGSLSMRDFLGPKRMDDLLDFLDGCMIKLALPVERGPFMECRKALINISLLGRSATEQERQKFIQNDTEKHLRDLFVRALSPMLTELSLRYEIILSIPS